MNYREPYQSADGTWLFVFDGQKYTGYETQDAAWQALQTMIVAARRREADRKLGEMIREAGKQFQEAISAAAKIEPFWTAHNMTSRVMAQVQAGNGDMPVGSTGFTARELATIIAVFRAFQAFLEAPVDVNGTPVPPVGVLYRIAE